MPDINDELFEENDNVANTSAKPGVNPNIDIDKQNDSVEEHEGYFTDDQTVIVNPILSKEEKKEMELLDDMTEEERLIWDRMLDPNRKKKILNYNDLYDDTVEFQYDLGEKYEYFLPILAAIKSGDFSVDLKKRYMIKAIDELWVETIEKHLTALDSIIRRPSKFIEQEEEVKPIELSRHINNRSIQHLSQHTDYISKVEGDTITPTKILNVFNEETMMTYENKFVNTLVNRLFAFVAKRYDAALKSGRDEKRSTFKMEGEFRYGKIEGKLSFGIEVAEEPEPNLKLKNYQYTADLWDRVEKIFEVVKGYSASEFVRGMGKAYIRPPVMRTNAIMKNKNLKECLELWQFIESYDNVGYEMLIQEDSETANEEYIKQLYKSATLQYLLFRHSIQNEFDDESTLASIVTDSPVKPKFIEDIKPLDPSEFDLPDTKIQKIVRDEEFVGKHLLSDEEKEIADAIDVALAADLILDEERREEELRKRREAEEARLRAEEEARLKAEEEERQRLEEERIRAEEEAARLAEEERQRRELEEQREAERRRKEEEEARIKAELDAAAAAEERTRLEKEELDKQRLLRIEQEVRGDAWRYSSKNKVSRKKKKAIRKAAEAKAESNDFELPKTFDYDTYMSYLYKEKIEESEKIIETKIEERLANEEEIQEALASGENVTVIDVPEEDGSEDNE